MLGGDGFGGEDAGGVLGVVAADGGAFRDFGARGGEGFAHLGGHGGGKFFEVGIEQRGEAAHPEDALVERLVGIGSRGACCEGELGVESLGCERVKAAKELSGGRIEGLNHKGSE